MFHCFTYDFYYPQGGMGDYLGAFPTLEEAKEKGLAQKQDCVNVAELRDGKLVVVTMWYGKKWHEPGEEANG